MGGGFAWGIMCLVMGLILIITFLPVYSVIITFINLGSLTNIMLGGMILIFVLVLLTFGFFGRRNETQGEVM